MGYTVIEDTILYEDKDLLVCHKPAGMPVQSRQVGSQDMEHALLGYLARKRAAVSCGDSSVGSAG